MYQINDFQYKRLQVQKVEYFLFNLQGPCSSKNKINILNTEIFGSIISEWPPVMYTLLCSDVDMLLLFLYSGNIRGVRPYLTGDAPCSACPQDLPYCTNNLCCELHALIQCAHFWCHSSPVSYNFSPLYSYSSAIAAIENQAPTVESPEPTIGGGKQGLCIHVYSNLVSSSINSLNKSM